MTSHIQLKINGSQGTELVHAEHLRNNVYRVLASPGFVLGVAAGDEIELGPDGRFQVRRRGGMIAVQLFSREPVLPFRSKLANEVRDQLQGALDGGIERGLVFTIPLAAGFSAITRLFDDFVSRHAGTEWMYGNVYDPATGAPLNWWQEGAGGGERNQTKDRDSAA